MTPALSAWEVDEMRALRRGGWPKVALATFYGVSERTVQRYLRGTSVERHRRPRKGDMD